MRILLACALACCAPSSAGAAEPKPAYFADGYHGGVYGHYPPGYTGFLVAQLGANPDWKINLEIEPETWDHVKASEPEAYAAFRAIMADQSRAGRVEIVNPGYGQSYLFQGSGESVIRQFEHGIRKTREHFPGATFTTYSSEEPCFTSCLPPVLRSFGFEFAVLKNPNTCWGGYTAARGGELVNWVGPDGSRLLAVPRYASEALQPGSCWQTIAWKNSPEYLRACSDQGIEHPVGMCLQDAGWRGGPWLGRPGQGASRYVTWREYIRDVTPGRTDQDWRFTQEDVRPGLMWGAQVLQRIAQQSRAAERRLLVAEKLAAMALVDAGRPPSTGAFDEAWRNVLLTQHHDCWIVPYNGRLGNTWADQVRRWTNLANATSDLSRQRSLDALLGGRPGRGRRFVRLFNPTAEALDAVAPVPIPATAEPSRAVSLAADGRRFATQVVASAEPGQSTLLVRAAVPPLGYATVELRTDADPTEAGVAATAGEHAVVLESDRYRLELDPSRGGTIRSLVAKSLGGREFVDTAGERRFNELRGHFYEDGGFQSSADRPATVRIVERGPLRATAEVAGTIAGHPFVQRVALTQGSPTIDCSVRIDWKGNPRIGEFAETNGQNNRRRPAYDDRFKLLALFPARLDGPRVAKDAPYDVCESDLASTSFNTWEDLKNNLILDWVDVRDRDGRHGLALLSDHTTSYAHGPDSPLGLTLQYSGKGLWGRDYRIDGPTEARYALVPHAGRWDEAGVPATSASWQEPVLGALSGEGDRRPRSLIDPGGSGWAVPAMFEKGGAIHVRLFNATGDDVPRDLGIGFEAEKVELVELDGRVVADLPPAPDAGGRRTVRLAIPRFGIRTLRFGRIKPPAPG